jgi:hypothetical protein
VQNSSLVLNAKSHASKLNSVDLVGVGTVPVQREMEMGGSTVSKCSAPIGAGIFKA